jgi:aminoglycoside phosphotransferase (APT) family kinase protein
MVGTAGKRFSMTKQVGYSIEQFIESCTKTEHFSDLPLGIESRIEGGTVNQCWKLKSADQFYLARLSQKLPKEFLTRWQAEIEIGQFAAQAGLSPEPIWVDTHCLAAIYPWCGEPLEKEQLSETVLEGLGQKISRLRQIDSPAKKISYRQTIESYLSVTGSSVDSESELLQLADRWDSDSDIGFCHHDLNSGNILWNGQSCKLIDWEYARLANPLFDLASLSHYFDLSDAQLEILLANYSDKSYSIDAVRIAETMVVGLERIWIEAANILIEG